MSVYDEIKVEASLDDLAMILNAAKCWEIADDKREAAEKKNAKLVTECETQANEIHQLRCRIIDMEKELMAWNMAKNATQPEADARAYLAEHNTPFEGKDVDTACEVIRALLAAKPEAAKPREVSPLLRQRIENAKDVLRQITPVMADTDGNYCEVAGDRFNSVYKTLQELYDVLRVEVQ
jgi:exonuclease V gamma subunit